VTDGLPQHSMAAMCCSKSHLFNALERDRRPATALLGRNVLQQSVCAWGQEGQALAVHLHLIDRLHARAVSH